MTDENDALFPKEEEDEIREEGSLLPALPRATNFLERLLAEPDKAESIVAAREKVFATLRRHAIKKTSPMDWVLFRGRDGSVAAHLRGAGAFKIATDYGIRCGRYRDEDGNPIREPAIRVEEDGSLTAYVVFDAGSVMTGLLYEGLRASRNSREKFVGRKEPGVFVSDVVLREDLRKAAYTAMMAKAARLLAQLTGVPEEELRANGIDTARCVKGSGYGTAKERDAAREAAPAASSEDRAESPPAQAPSNGAISEKQVKRMWALAFDAAKGNRDRAKELVRAACEFVGVSKEAEIPATRYEEAVDVLTGGR